MTTLTKRSLNFNLSNTSISDYSNKRMDAKTRARIDAELKILGNLRIASVSPDTPKIKPRKLKKRSK